MLRALPFDFRSDPATYDIRDQFMFGPALMVNPVTSPMLYDCGSKPISGAVQTRPVYLPAGADWYDFWTGQKYTGGQTIQADAPISRLPLYVRSGSILPMGPARQHKMTCPKPPSNFISTPVRMDPSSFTRMRAINIIMRTVRFR